MRDEPRFEPAAERRADDFAALAPERAPADPPFEARFAVLRAPPAAFLAVLPAFVAPFLAVFVAEVFFAGRFFAVVFFAVLFFAVVLRPVDFLAVVRFLAELVPFFALVRAPPEADSTAATAAPAAASAAFDARFAAVTAADAARDALDDDAFRLLVAAALFPADLRLVLLEPELLLRAGAI